MAKPKRRWRREPDEIEVLVPVNALTPTSACPHGRDISRGQYCPVCDKLKLRNRHYRLRRDPRTDPKPESKKKFAPDLPGGLGSVKAKPEWELPGIGKVKAWTKSEARAMFKEKLGVSRLPVGSKVAKVTR